MRVNIYFIIIYEYNKNDKYNFNFLYLKSIIKIRQIKKYRIRDLFCK